MFAATPAYAAYTTNCNGPDVSPYTGVNNEHEYLELNSGSITGGYATVKYYPVKACTPINGLSSVSLVFPVTLQNPVCGAQIGYGAWYTTNYWLYTPVDDCVVEAITDWPAPISGHTYILGVTIDYSLCDGPKWTYTMHDFTAGGGTYLKCGSRSVASVQKIWSGFEVYDNGDQMGGSSNSVMIQDITFQLNNASWYYITNTNVIKNVGSGPYTGATRSYWHTTAQSISGHARLYSYTDNTR